KELGVLNCITAQSTDAENPEHPIRAERARIAELLDTAIRCHACVGERGDLLECQMVGCMDQIASRHRHELRASTIRPEPGPTYVRADMRIAHQAMTAGAIAPTGRDDHMMTLLESGGLGHDSADLVDDAGDLVTHRDRRRDVGVFPEVPVDE